MLTIWDIFKYLYKWKVFIVIVVILAVLGSYNYSQEIQCYSSEVVIEFAGENAKQGKTADGSTLDVYEILSSNVISAALLDIDSKATVDMVRNATVISPIIPTFVEEIEKSKLKDGEEYEYIPTQYSIKFVDYYGNNGNYVRNVLDAVINNYTEFYSEKYLNQQAITRLDKETVSGNHDYIESANIINDYTNDVIGELEGLMGGGGSRYRSTATGMSFYDLKTKYEQIRKYKLTTLFSDIQREQITKNEDVLIKKYQLKHDNLLLENKNLAEKSNLALALMEAFAGANKEVPNGYNYAYNGQNNDDVDTTEIVTNYRYSKEPTTYDGLVDKYVAEGIEAENARIDAEYCSDIIDVFSAKDPRTDRSTLTDGINSDITEMCSELDELYELTNKTISGYNGYTASQYIKYLSGVSLGKTVNVQVNMILAFVISLSLSVLLALTVEILKFAKSLNNKKDQEDNEDIPKDIDDGDTENA